MFGNVLEIERVFGTIRSMDRTNVRRRLAGSLVLGLMLASWAGPLKAAVLGSAPVPVSATTVVVRAGDTLWAIAGRVAPDLDRRPVVRALAEANDIQGTRLDPGQILVVPADLGA